jgi:hypothetical protein
MTFPLHPPAPASRGRLVATGAIALFAALLLFTAPTPARAGLVLQVENSSAPPGGTGSFDVILSDTAGTFAVSGFQVELSVPGASGVHFSGVDTSTTTAPYLFGTLQTPPLSFDTFPNTTFTASDSDATPPFFVTLNPGDEFGLAHVTYTVDTGTTLGTLVPVSIVTGGTFLFDNTTPIPNSIPYTPVNGTITVTVSTIPEPSTVVTAAIGGTCFLAVSWLRARRRGR